MTLLYRNNAESTLATGISGATTTLQLPAGHAARFPVPNTAAGETFRITLEEGATREIVECTANNTTTDVLTVVRGVSNEAGNTANQSFSAGATVSLRWTQGSVAEIYAEVEALRADARAPVGAMQELASVTTAGSQASVSFSSIPATFKDLLVTIRARGTAAANTVVTRMTFNGDSGSNYDYRRENRFGNSGGTNAAFIDPCTVPGNNSAAGSFGVANIFIRDYTRLGSWKTVMSQSTDYDATGMLHQQGCAWWKNTTDPITSLSLVLASGNFADGSIVTLYGVGGVPGARAAYAPVYTKYDPFCPPALPSSLNDEFLQQQSGTPAGWTAQGGTAVAVETRLGSLRIRPLLSSGRNKSALEKTLPSGPFTIATHVTNNGYATYHECGLYLRNTTSGKVKDIRLFNGPSNDTTRFNTAVCEMTGFSTNGAVPTDQVFFANHQFQRVVYDGTTIYWEISVDGRVWRQLHSETATTYFSGGNLPDRFGVNAASVNASSNFDAVFDFVRYFPVAFADIGREIGVGSDGVLIEPHSLFLHHKVI